MSDTTTLWEVCEHGHAWGCYSEDCPGGRERTFMEAQWCEMHNAPAIEPQTPSCKLIDLAPPLWVEVTE